VALIEFEHVRKTFRRGSAKITVLDDASFTVDAGEFVGVWGQARSGKSTLLNLCAGLELPDAGRVLIDGVSMSEMRSSARARLLGNEIGYASTGFVHERSALARAERVVDHLTVPLVGAGLSPIEGRQKARAFLVDLGAIGCIDARLDELSLGDRTIVALARALLREPRVLLIDEPEVCPNPDERARVRRLVRSLGERPDLTVIVTSASPGALKGVHRAFSIGNGRVRADGRMADVIPIDRDRPARDQTG
jgi:putative ABC transport system ATP-binding protein